MNYFTKAYLLPAKIIHFLYDGFFFSTACMPVCVQMCMCVSLLLMSKLSTFFFTKKGLDYYIFFCFFLFLSLFNKIIFVRDCELLFRRSVFFFQTNKFSDSLIYLNRLSNFERYKAKSYRITLNMFM